MSFYITCTLLRSARVNSVDLLEGPKHINYTALLFTFVRVYCSGLYVYFSVFIICKSL